MSSSVKYLILLSTLAMAPAHAVDSASDDLTRIEAETLVLKAREKQLDVQAKIIAKQSEIASRQSESERFAKSAVVGNPVITAIEGMGKSMFATLQLENGSVVDVKSGDMLSNGLRVVSIRPNEVIIEDAGKKRIRLASAGTPQPSFDPSFPSAGLRLPPLAPPGTVAIIPPPAPRMPAR